MKRSLLQKLDLGKPESSKRLADLLAEDPEVAQVRKQLATNIERLEKVLVELRNLDV